MNKKRKQPIPDAIYTKHSIYNVHYHLIWCTKYRNQTFTTPELVNEMKELLLETAAGNEISIEKMEVMPDHIHLLISFSPKKAAASVVKGLKGRTARLFLKKHPEIRNSQFWGGNLWSGSYYFGSLGNMSKDVVEKYINDQRYNKTKKP